MRFLRQSLTGLFLLSLTLGLLMWAGLIMRDAVQERLSADARSPQARERVFAVNVLTAEPGQVTPVLRAFGEVQSLRTLELRAASSGQIVEIAPNFEEGAVVSEGQLLVRVDPAAAEDALARAEADMQDATAEQAEAQRAISLEKDELAAAEEQADLRQRALERQRDLSARGVGTAAAEEQAELSASSARQAVLTRRQALAQAEARLDQARTRVLRSEISLAEAERKVEETEIRASFNGTLSDVSGVAGGLVTANEKLASLIDPRRLEVAFRVPIEAYSRFLNADGDLAGAPVKVTLDVLGTDLVSGGVLVRDSAAVGEGQTGRLLYARLDAPLGLKPGDFVTVEVEEPPLDFVVEVPARAVNAANEILVLGEEDRLESLQVNLLRRQGDNVLIRSRELRGREIVTERSPFLGAGIKVRPLRLSGEEMTELEEPKMLELTDERRAKLRAFVEANKRMPSEAKARILSQLEQAMVPARMVERIEARMGG